MFPINSVDNPAHMSPINPKACSYLTLRQASGAIQSANFKNVSLGEPDPTMAFASRSGAVTKLIVLILFERSPTQVAGTIIEGVAISMRHLLLVWRARTMKCPTNDYMHMNRTALKLSRAANPDRIIWPSPAELPQHPGIEHPPSVLSVDPPINRPHPPQAGGLVARISRHLAPFLGLLYTSSSHVALLTSDVVRGRAAGWRLSSAPHGSSGLFPRQLTHPAISLAATRS